MLAVRKPSATAPPRVVEDAPVPEVGPTDVRIGVRAASLCGSDLEVLTGESSPRFDYPLIVGHEGAGEVVAVGSAVEALSVGDRVAVHYPTTCDRCSHCLAGRDNRCPHRASVGTHRDGTFAEFVSVPARNALHIGDLPYEWASIASCAVSTAYHAVTVAGVGHGETVVVIGAGGVGLHAVMWAKFFGASTVVAVDIAQSTLPLAEAFGADHAVDPSAQDVHALLDDLTDGRGADAAIECSGASAALETAVDAVNGTNRYASGSVVSVGLQTEPLTAGYWDLREGTLAVSGDHTRGELHRILQLLQAETVDLSRSITHRLPLADVFDAVDLLTGVVDTDDPICRISLSP
jgi:2-desacetyl-2-hydroxyethyl bacteriochlorophyllide A dehydrogenase